MIFVLFGQASSAGMVLAPVPVSARLPEGLAWGSPRGSGTDVLRRLGLSGSDEVAVGHDDEQPHPGTAGTAPLAERLATGTWGGRPGR